VSGSRAQTNGAKSAFAKASADDYLVRFGLCVGGLRTAKACGSGIRADVKLPVATSIQPDRSAIKPAATVTNKNSSPGRARHKP